jgi:hypothetical protein
LTKGEDAVRRLLAEDLVAGDVARAIRRTFRFVEVAEEELARASLSSRRARVRFKGLFAALYPGEMVGYADDVFRHHCRELIGRARRGEDLSPGTDAEVLIALSSASLRAPPDADHAHAMSVVFARVFPDSALEPAGSESWPGRLGEILGELRSRVGRER